MICFQLPFFGFPLLFNLAQLQTTLCVRCAFVLYWILICTLRLAVTTPPNSLFSPSNAHLLGPPLKAHRIALISFAILSESVSLSGFSCFSCFFFGLLLVCRKPQSVCENWNVTSSVSSVRSFSPCTQLYSTLDTPATAVSCLAFLLVCRWQSLTTLRGAGRERLGGENGGKKGLKGREKRGSRPSCIAWMQCCMPGSALSADSTQYKFLFANRLHSGDL